MKAVVFNAPRTGYSIEQVAGPMTVREMIELLEGLLDEEAVQEDDIIVMSHDNGYTYGTAEFMDVRRETEGEYGPELIPAEE